MTIEKLKAHTKVTNFQLDTEIGEADMILLAKHFDNVETLSVQLRLDPSQRKDIKMWFFLTTLELQWTKH